MLLQDGVSHGNTGDLLRKSNHDHTEVGGWRRHD